MTPSGGNYPGQSKPKPTMVTAATVPVIDAAQLFTTGNEVRLAYRGQEYRLRVTRQGKLILTK